MSLPTSLKSLYSLKSSSRLDLKTKETKPSNTYDPEYEKIMNTLKREFDNKWNDKGNHHINITGLMDFEPMRTLGSGSFGRVVLVKHKASNKFYAIKILDKEKIVKLRQVQHTKNEKHILETINYPFTVFIEFSFKDNNYLYFVLPFVNGGEMFTHLRRKRKFEEELSKFYAAQVLLTLEYLHEMDLIYRDLKPENILIDNLGYIKVTDFGFCKMVKSRTWTLCGTPEYLAPEIILCKGYGQTVDWWSFGILMYEMSAGYPPFCAPDSMKTYEKIVAGKFKFPEHFSEELKDLLRNTIQLDLSKRFGSLKTGTNDFRAHRWFQNINWLNIYHRQVQAPYIPTIKGQGDASHFQVYQDEPLKISSTEQFPNEFADF